MAKGASALTALLNSDSTVMAADKSHSPRLEKKLARPRAPGVSRDKILMVATRMFAENGFSGTSIRDIAHDCDLTLPSIYHFFGDKESLYRHCLETTIGAATQRLRDALDSAATPKAGVLQYTIALCDMLLNDENCRRLMQRSLLVNDRKDVEELAHNLSTQFGMLTSAIERLDGIADPAERGFELYALTIGLVQIRRVGESAGFDPRRFSTPIHLAVSVLSTILPSINWSH